MWTCLVSEQTKTNVRLFHQRPLVNWVRPRAAPYIIASIVVITSLWIASGKFEHAQQADSLIPVLVSLQHWTPLLWASDRFGMLIPLLAIPFRHPLTNMIVQSALGIFVSMTASFFLLRYFFGNSLIWLVAASFQNIWLLLLVTKTEQFDWFVYQCYAPSLALGFAALDFMRKRRWRAALLLMLLSHWQNFGAFVVLLPVVVVHALICKTWRDLPYEIGITMAGATVGMLAEKVSTVPRVPTTLDPASSWVFHWLQLLQHFSVVLVSPSALWWMIVPAALGAAVLIFTSREKYPLWVACGLISVGIIVWLFTGTLVWVRLNGFLPRYMFSSVFLFSVAMAVLAVGPFQRASQQHARTAAVVASGLIFAAAAVVYGRPSRAWVQRDIDHMYGARTADILASHASIVAGRYWVVWPDVFDANLALYRRGEHRRIYGLTLRGQDTLLDWGLQRSVCAAVPIGDPDAEYWMNISPRHFHYVRRMSTIDLYCED